MILADDRSLSAVLAELGYTHAPGPWQGRAILRDGVVVFAGAWYGIWRWLTDRGEVVWAARPAVIDEPGVAAAVTATLARIAAGLPARSWAEIGRVWAVAA